jgi:hypothetical protein
MPFVPCPIELYPCRKKGLDHTIVAASFPVRLSTGPGQTDTALDNVMTLEEAQETHTTSAKSSEGFSIRWVGGDGEGNSA